MPSYEGIIKLSTLCVILSVSTDWLIRKIMSVWHQTHDITNKYNDVSCEGLYIITACPIGLIEILVIMSISTFITAIILYINQTFFIAKMWYKWQYMLRPSKLTLLFLSVSIITCLTSRLQIIFIIRVSYWIPMISLNEIEEKIYKLPIRLSLVWFYDLEIVY